MPQASLLRVEGLNIEPTNDSPIQSPEPGTFNPENLTEGQRVETNGTPASSELRVGIDSEGVGTQVRQQVLQQIGEDSGVQGISLDDTGGVLVLGVERGIAANANGVVVTVNDSDGREISKSSGMVRGNRVVADENDNPYPESAEVSASFNEGDIVTIQTFSVQEDGVPRPAAIYKFEGRTTGPNLFVEDNRNPELTDGDFNDLKILAEGGIVGNGTVYLENVESEVFTEHGSQISASVQEFSRVETRTTESVTTNTQVVGGRVDAENVNRFLSPLETRSVEGSNGEEIGVVAGEVVPSSNSAIGLTTEGDIYGTIQTRPFNGLFGHGVVSATAQANPFDSSLGLGVGYKGYIGDIYEPRLDPETEEPVPDTEGNIVYVLKDTLTNSRVFTSYVPPVVEEQLIEAPLDVNGTVTAKTKDGLVIGKPRDVTGPGDSAYENVLGYEITYPDGSKQLLVQSVGDVQTEEDYIIPPDSNASPMDVTTVRMALIPQQLGTSELQPGAVYDLQTDDDGYPVLYNGDNVIDILTPQGVDLANFEQVPDSDFPLWAIEDTTDRFATADIPGVFDGLGGTTVVGKDGRVANTFDTNDAYFGPVSYLPTEVVVDSGQRFVEESQGLSVRGYWEGSLSGNIAQWTVIREETKETTSQDFSVSGTALVTEETPGEFTQSVDTRTLSQRPIDYSTGSNGELEVILGDPTVTGSSTNTSAEFIPTGEPIQQFQVLSASEVPVSPISVSSEVLSSSRNTTIVAAAGVTLGTGLEVWLPRGVQYTDSGAVVRAGVEYNFPIVGKYSEPEGLGIVLDFKMGLGLTREPAYAYSRDENTGEVTVKPLYETVPVIDPETGEVLTEDVELYDGKIAKVPVNEFKLDGDGNRIPLMKPTGESDFRIGAEVFIPIDNGFDDLDRATGSFGIEIGL